MVRSKATKDAFIKYLEEHPNERFWQAVRNFSDWPFILASAKVPDMKDRKYMLDTFYWEEREK